MRIVQITYAVIAALIVVGCSTQPNYLVSIYQVDDENKKEINQFYKQSQALLNQENGHYLDEPLLIEQELPNKAMPEVTTDFPGNYVLIAKFNSHNDLERYLENKDVKESMDKITQLVRKESIFSAREFNPMGMLDSPPALGSVIYRENPAFIMVNAFTFKTMLNPMNPYRMKSYMDTNEPKILAAGVRILMPFEKIKNIKGSFDFQALFFTEWPSKQGFDDFHQNKEFIDLAKKRGISP